MQGRYLVVDEDALASKIEKGIWNLKDGEFEGGKHSAKSKSQGGVTVNTDRVASL